MSISPSPSLSSASSSASPFMSENMEIVAKNVPEDCQVCGQKAHGLHFGAFTCRACAAFFRRVAAGANFVVKCRRGDMKCDIVPNGRSCCKKCRLKKCESIGMDIHNFQFDRDPISTTKRIIPLSLANFLGRPQFIIFCDPETASSSKDSSAVIDLSELIEKAVQTFTNTTNRPPKTAQNRLKKLAMGLNIDRDADEEAFRKIKNIGLRETLSLWEHDFLGVAAWFSYFDEFQELDIDVRMTFLKCFWHIWNRLEKLARTALVHRKDKKRSVLYADNVEIDVETMVLDIHWLTKFSLEQVAYYIEGIGDVSFFHLIPLLADLDPSDVELNYMMTQLSFQHAAKKLGGKYADISERLQEILAGDLHNYYVRDLQLVRYSDRIIKMGKVNNSINKFLWERQEKMHIAKTFDIFHVKFSHPEMFDGIYS